MNRCINHPDRKAEYSSLTKALHPVGEGFGPDELCHDCAALEVINYSHEKPALAYAQAV